MTLRIVKAFPYLIILSFSMLMIVWLSSLELENILPGQVLTPTWSKKRISNLWGRWPDNNFRVSKVQTYKSAKECFQQCQCLIVHTQNYITCLCYTYCAHAHAFLVITYTEHSDCPDFGSTWNHLRAVKTRK